jgi:hypothetical protein
LRRLTVVTVGAGRRSSACLSSPPERMNVVSAETPMTDHFYTFNSSPEQLRRWGARGGQSIRPQPAGPAHTSSDATPTCPAMCRAPSNHREKHRDPRRTFSLAARSGKATVLKQSSTAAPMRSFGGIRRKSGISPAIRAMTEGEFANSRFGRVCGCRGRTECILLPNIIAVPYRHSAPEQPCKRFPGLAV